MSTLHAFNSRVVQRHLWAIRCSENSVLQYDHRKFQKNTKDCLALGRWNWPSNRHGERVTPSDLYDHRNSHRMHAPFCICPLIEGLDTPKEAAFHMPLTGRLAGKYIAVCAEGKCGYLVILENLYNQRGLSLQYYPLRDHRTPPALYYQGSDNDILKKIEKVQPQPSPLSLFFRLDAVLNPGLTEAEFTNLFMKCHCDLFMTHRALESHTCVEKKRDLDELMLELEEEMGYDEMVIDYEVIDLTIDDSDDALDYIVIDS